MFAASVRRAKLENRLQFSKRQQLNGSCPEIDDCISHASVAPAQLTTHPRRRPAFSSRWLTFVDRLVFDRLACVRKATIAT